MRVQIERMQDTYQGSLFSSDFLTESTTRLSDWSGIDDAATDALAVRLSEVFAHFPTRQSPNESQTEDDLIWPILGALGWTASLRQQNLTPKGREDVPDGLLFKDAAAKAQANRTPEEWRRYEFGLAIVESKRWTRPLDRRSGRHGEETAPSTQMLRYLRRVEDLTTGKLRWGNRRRSGFLHPLRVFSARRIVLFALIVFSQPFGPIRGDHIILKHRD